MYYVARSLYLPAGEPLAMYVVEVKEGVVTGWFPFDGERASMLWAEVLLVSYLSDAEVFSDIANEVAIEDNHTRSLFLYTLADGSGVVAPDAPLKRL